MLLNGVKPSKYVYIKILVFFPSFLFLLNNYYKRYDNNNNVIFYENNMDFSNYSTDIKAIALYLPSIYYINQTFFHSYNINNLIFSKNVISLYIGQHQHRLFNKKYICYSNLKAKIYNQIELAKSHGIYGFAIYYYWFSGKTIFDKELTIIYKNKKNFHYMLIWKNEKAIIDNNETILDVKYKENNTEEFIKDIKKYLIDKLYIRTNGKPILGIYNIKTILNIREIILQFKQKARELEILI